MKLESRNLNNQKPKYQKYSEYFVVTLIAIFVIYSAIDGLSSAIDFITKPIAIYGTIAAIIIFAISFFTISIPWKTREGKLLTVKKLGVKYRLISIAIIIASWFPLIMRKQYPDEIINQPISKLKFQPLFSTKDSTSFNVLIVRFEDFAEENNTRCIGRSIEDVLNTNTFQEKIELKVQYADSILSPTSIDKATSIQKRHNADLILFGKADNIKLECKGADVCFRYNLNEALLGKTASPVELKENKFDRKPIPIIPSELTHEISFDIATLENWIVGLYHVKKGNLNRAVIEIDKIVGNETLSKKTRSQRLSDFGRSFIQLRQDSLASFVLEKSILLDPFNPNPYLQKAKLLWLNKEFEKSEEILNSGKEITIDSSVRSKFYLELGMVSLRKTELKNMSKGYSFGEIIESTYQNIPKAIDFFEKSIKADSLNYRPLMEIGLLKLNSSFFYEQPLMGILPYTNSNLERAQPYFKKALELKPDLSFLVNSNLGVYFSKNGEYTTSLEYHTKAIDDNPRDYQSYINRHVVYAKMGDLDMAINDLNIAITLEPTWDLAYQQRASRYRDAGEINLAINDFKKAISLDKKNPLPLLNLGEIYFRQRKFDVAENILLKAKRLDIRNDWGRIDLLLNQIESIKTHQTKKDKSDKVFNQKSSE